MPKVPEGLICFLCGEPIVWVQSRCRSICGPCYCLRYLIELKKRAIIYLGGKCRRCGGVFPDEVYDFHHRDASLKEFHISRKSVRWATLVKELDKCDLLCANCHRIETRLQFKRVVKIEESIADRSKGKTPAP